MHPQVMKDEPGKCTLCGMDLVPMGGAKKEAHSHLEHHHHDHKEHSAHSEKHRQHTENSYDKHEGHHTNDFLKRFWLSIIITVPILLLSHMIQEWLGFSLKFPGDKYVLLALGTIIYIYGGMPFLKGMLGEIKAKAIGMMTLVAIAITVAYVYSGRGTWIERYGFLLGIGNPYCDYAFGTLVRNVFYYGSFKSIAVIGGAFAKRCYCGTKW